MMSCFPNPNDDTGLERPLTLQLRDVVQRVRPVEVDDGVLLRTSVGDARRADVFESVATRRRKEVQRKHLSGDGVRRRERRFVSVEIQLCVVQLGRR